MTSAGLTGHNEKISPEPRMLKTRFTVYPHRYSGVYFVSRSIWNRPYLASNRQEKSGVSSGERQPAMAELLAAYYLSLVLPSIEMASSIDTLEIQAGEAIISKPREIPTSNETPRSIPGTRAHMAGDVSLTHS